MLLPSPTGPWQVAHVMSNLDAAGNPVIGVLNGAARPTVPFATSDFWVHGFVLGLEVRY